MTQILTDAHLLDTIASNLVSIAFRYTSRGGHVEARVRQRHDTLVFAVRDTCVGIAVAQQQRIVERLYRTHETRDRTTRCSGLFSLLT